MANPTNTPSVNSFSLDIKAFFTQGKFKRNIQNVHMHSGCNRVVQDVLTIAPSATVTYKVESLTNGVFLSCDNSLEITFVDEDVEVLKFTLPSFMFIPTRVDEIKIENKNSNAQQIYIVQIIQDKSIPSVISMSDSTYVLSASNVW